MHPDETAIDRRATFVVTHEDQFHLYGHDGEYGNGYTVESTVAEVIQPLQMMEASRSYSSKHPQQPLEGKHSLRTSRSLNQELSPHRQSFEGIADRFVVNLLRAVRHEDANAQRSTQVFSTKPISDRNTLEKQPETTFGRLGFACSSRS